MKCRIVIAFVLLFFGLNAQNIKRKGMLGVGLYTSISDSLKKATNLQTTKGALINFVVPNSSADALKLQTLDLIVSINNTEINSAADVFAIAKLLKADDLLSVKVLRKNKTLNLKGKVMAKPYEQSNIAKISYGEFKFEQGYIRTILRKPINKKEIGVVYFVQGISCYSLDNMQAKDPTKLALDAMIEKGFAVYTVEKSGVGDSYSCAPCEQIGYNKELEVYREGYKNLLQLKDIDTSAIFVFGHSLGGISAPLLAQEFQPKGVVVYGCGLKPWSEYLLDAYMLQQQLYGVDLASLRDTVEFMKPTFNELFYKNQSAELLSKDPKHLLALQIGLGYDVNTKLGFAGRTVQFHKEINDQNLAKAWRGTRSYVLAIYGEADIAANNEYDHKAIAEYVNQVHPNKGTFLLMPKTNHTFQEVGTMPEFIKMQSNPIAYEKYASEHFNTKLFDVVCDWMKDKLAKQL